MTHLIIMALSAMISAVIFFIVIYIEIRRQKNKIFIISFMKRNGSVGEFVEILINVMRVYGYDTIRPTGTDAIMKASDPVKFSGWTIIKNKPNEGNENGERRPEKEEPKN